ncbi:venom acid phosphatase Acph-1-like [Anthonomus grandis grandis]|uniref:venom acid phosphatase Acph-1-like n=1 Tax=Anthonomus grandis grandis TaxID=2921223 RepID=UPI0021663899|nr:venom acid phosphatase Acph-1-like [Anthonomus grandis grandis]
MSLLTINTFVIIVFSFVCVKGMPKTSNEDSLVLVHTIFRHGDRTPDSPGYANNPINESFFPEGYGQLTKEGKRTEYRLGTTLRKRYNHFLGQTWNINYLEARSTNFNRTKMSLQLVLAALYPPRDYQVWFRNLDWQPIPYNVFENDEEFLFFLCKKYTTELDKTQNSNDIRAAISIYDDVFKYLSEKTGESFSSAFQVFSLYFSLLTQKEYGYPLEDWVIPIWPDVFVRIAVDNYYILTNTTSLKQGSGGALLKKILRDSRAKIKGTISPSDLKMYLYSGHDLNIATMLLTLGVFDEKIPSYGSHILFELHLVNGVYGFKIFHQDWSTEYPRLLTIPGCTAFCPFDQFEALVADVIPQDGFCSSL